jgi:exopolyphosphatase/guanosine-5'-triphosphate,3'-diphosphate pyrophosphatase
MLQKINDPENTMQKSFDCDAHNPIIAAIDLGTNSCRLLIARTNVAGARTTYFRTRPKAILWKIIDSYSKVIRLGEGLQNNNYLSEDAINRALDALSSCKKKIEKYNVSKIRVVATEACRRAVNSNILVERAYNELGFNVEIIDSQEEGFLALKGCVSTLNPNIPYAIVFDIGGGSTEVVWVHLKKDSRSKPGYHIPFEVLDSISLPHGVVITTERFQQKKEFNLDSAIQEINSELLSHLSDFKTKNNIQELLNNNLVQMIGSSGTVTTLASLHLGLSNYNRRMVDGINVSREDLNKVMDIIFSDPTNYKKNDSGNLRIEYVVVGSMILKAISEIFPMKNIRVADRGVREGILIDLVRFLIRV